MAAIPADLTTRPSRHRWAATAGTPAALSTGFALVGASPISIVFLSAVGALAVGGFRAIINGSAF
jgi:hypothetical protein